MVDIANHFRVDPNAFERGYDRVNALQQDQARLRAGNALTGGNYQAAAGELFGAGDTEEGARLAHYGTQRDALQLQQTQNQEKLAWETIGDVAGQLMNVYRRNPEKVGSAFDAVAGRLAEVGETPEEIAQTRVRLLADPEGTLLALGAAAEDRFKAFNTADGLVGLDTQALQGGLDTPGTTKLLYENKRDPLEDELMRAKIDATKSLGGQRDASAAKARRSPAPKGGGQSLPAGFILD
jgi:hypothetical protein